MTRLPADASGKYRVEWTVPVAVSQHLAKLRLAHLVQSRRDGNRIYYLSDDDHVRRLVKEALFHADSDVRGRDGRKA